MSEWIWLIVGVAWGLWVNLSDAKYYKGIMELQDRYIKLLHKKYDDEPKLSLSVDECKEAMRKLETFNVTDLSVKICRFLKENS